MKSLFKRSLAAATSSVLALGQLAVIANVNINVAAAEVINKTFVLNVQTTAEDVANAELTAGYALVGHSDWSQKVGAAVLGSEDKTFTTALEQAKAKAKNAILNRSRGYVDSASVDELLAGLSDLTVNVYADTVTADGNVALSNVGETLGGIIENVIAKRAGTDQLVADDGAPINVDWADFTVAGEIEVKAKLNIGENSAEYVVTIKDENGKELADDKAIEAYALGKFEEAKTIIENAAKKSGHPVDDLLARLDNYSGKADNAAAYTSAFVDAVKAIKDQATDLDTLYASYTEKVEEAGRNSGISEKNADRIVNKVDSKKPASVDEAFANEYVQKGYDKAVSIINDKFADVANVQLTLDDIQGIIDEAKTVTEASPNKFGVDFSSLYQINGDDAAAILFIEDDQAAELTEYFVQNKSVEEYLNEGWTVVLNAEDGTQLTELEDGKEYEVIGVASKKLISASADTENGLSGVVTYDVQHAVHQIIVEEKVVETTATTADETTTSPDSTTTSPDQTTDPDQTTTAATYVSFELEGAAKNGLVYWSEETTDFDISDLSVSLRVVEAGVATDLKIDVTDAFELEAKSPADLDHEIKYGVDAHEVFFILKDAAAVQKALTDAGYGQDLIEQEGIVEGKRGGSFTVYLVLRGDVDLNAGITISDPMYGLVYYTESVVSEHPSRVVVEGDDNIYLANKGDNASVYFPYSHYALDAYDGDGVINISDVQCILSYYTYVIVTERKIDWDHEAIVGQHITPLEELHASPLQYDKRAADYVEEGFDHSVAQ